MYKGSLTNVDYTGNNHGFYKSKLKRNSKNLLLKRLVDGEEVEVRVLDWGRGAWCLYSYENNRAVGFVVEYDKHKNVLLESIFDVKIYDDHTFKINRDSNVDIVELRQFKSRVTIKIDYFMTKARDIYKRERCDIVLT